jgi:hypothetical protein
MAENSLLRLISTPSTSSPPRPKLAWPSTPTYWPKRAPTRPVTAFSVVSSSPPPLSAE